MVFMGCHTGTAISNGDRLPKRAVNTLGVDSSVGFDANIGFDSKTSDVWAAWFAYYGMTVHDDVYDSAWGAAEAVKTVNGSYSGYNYPVVYGGGTKIYPAAYGS
jgi:hypothetical protein